jgi:hypothetical protein
MDKDKEMAIRMIDEFEDLLEKYNLKIPNEDREGNKEEANIYGKEYYKLEDKLTKLIKELNLRGVGGGKKKKHKMIVTSLLAFQEILPELEKREIEVLKAVKKIQPCNNLMIANALNLPVNCITGRIFSLRKYNLVHYYKKEKCPCTNRLTIFWKIPEWINPLLSK